MSTAALAAGIGKNKLIPLNKQAQVLTGFSKKTAPACLRGHCHSIKYSPFLFWEMCRKTFSFYIFSVLRKAKEEMMLLFNTNYVYVLKNKWKKPFVVKIGRWREIKKMFKAKLLTWKLLLSRYLLFYFVLDYSGKEIGS